MKRLTLLLGLACVIITGCLIYMVREGIGLRAAPLIRPSEMNADRSNVARAVVHRLFPEFQNAEVVVVGALPETPDSRSLLDRLRLEYAKSFKKNVTLLEDAVQADDAILHGCPAPCWLLVPRDTANELSPQAFIENRIKPLHRAYFNLTVIDFERGLEIPEGCIEEKRLSYRCLSPLVIHESARKMKNPAAKYFFMRKYNENDYFLFLQR